MGSTHISLSDALFTQAQQRVLGPLFGNPQRTYYANELVRLAAMGTGAVRRELDKLASAGLLTVQRIGNQKHYQANADAPIFAELCAITNKTFGLAEPLRAALAPLAPRIRVAFIYGSVAAGSDTAASDIDVFIVGRRLRYPDVMAALAETEAALGRKVSPTLYTTAELEKKLAAGNAFARRVLDQPKIFLLGSAGDLPEPRPPRPDR